jgi:transposase-like protein
LTQPITKELKDKVIREYFQGKSRNENARNTGLGAGTVTNIIQQFNNKLGEYEPEAIRELAVQLRKAAITPNDCVRGAQIMNKMIDLGIDKEDCLTVLENVQTRSIEKGVAPEECGKIISQLFEISKSESMPLDEVPDYVRQKVQEDQRLDVEIHVREMNLADLKNQTDIQLRQNKVTIENISSYLALRNELADLRIPETDIQRATNVIRSVKKQAFDANRLIRIASTTRSLEDQVNDLRNQSFSFSNALSPYKELVTVVQGGTRCWWWCCRCERISCSCR